MPGTAGSPPGETAYVLPWERATGFARVGAFFTTAVGIVLAPHAHAPAMSRGPAAPAAWFVWAVALTGPAAWAVPTVAAWAWTQPTDTEPLSRVTVLASMVLHVATPWTLACANALGLDVAGRLVANRAPFRASFRAGCYLTAGMVWCSVGWLLAVPWGGLHLPEGRYIGTLSLLALSAFLWWSWLLGIRRVLGARTHMGPPPFRASAAAVVVATATALTMCTCNYTVLPLLFGPDVFGPAAP